jgi:hypothetical protein
MKLSLKERMNLYGNRERVRNGEIAEFECHGTVLQRLQKLSYLNSMR